MPPLPTLHQSMISQMLRLVELFASRVADRSTLDELGFGPIRDAFSDHFFPGISTIQTRARYLLFVPWVYLRIERERRGPPRGTQAASSRRTR